MSKQTQLEAMRFVYQQALPPYKCVVVDADKARDSYDKNKRWRHTATIDPALWIAHLLNHPSDRATQVESLFWGNLSAKK